MKPLLILWLVRHGWPAACAPDYAMMVGFSTLLGSVLVLRQAERDGVSVHVQARALVCAYAGALLGGYVFEWLRAIPSAVHAHSFAPIAFAGRAAYGGLIFGALAPVVYLRWRKATFLDFLDRATLGMGIVFACVRFGCFLEGCDFGRPTASILGVRFPAGSQAADAHVLAGWIPSGTASLPVHPTELYESAVGLLATCLALVPLRRGRRDGAAFATWLVVYALGRFLVELLRGDVERGRYASLSTAQWVSLAILGGVFVLSLARRRRLLLAAAAGLGLVLTPRPARADEPLKPATAEEAIPATPAPAPKPAPEPQHGGRDAPQTPPPEPLKRITARVGLASSVTIARPDVPSGWALELDGLYRLYLSEKTRLDVGLEGRRYENVEAIHYSLGIAAELVLSGGKHFEMLFTIVPHHTWFDFKSDFFSNTNAYGVRYGMGAQFPVGPIVFGLTPLAFNTTSSTTVGVISQYEPRLWVGASF